MLGFCACQISSVIRPTAASKGCDAHCHVAFWLTCCANLQVCEIGAHNSADRKPVGNCRRLLPSANNSCSAAPSCVVSRSVGVKRPKRQINGAYPAFLIAFFQFVRGKPATAYPFAEKLHCLIAVNLERDNAVRGQTCILFCGQNVSCAAHGADCRRLRSRQGDLSATDLAGYLRAGRWSCRPFLRSVHCTCHIGVFCDRRAV